MTTSTNLIINAFENAYRDLTAIYCNAAYVFVTPNSEPAKTDLNQRISQFLSTTHKDVLDGLPNTCKFFKGCNVNNQNHVLSLIDATKKDAQGMKNLQLVIGKIKDINKSRADSGYTSSSSACPSPDRTVSE